MKKLFLIVSAVLIVGCATKPNPVYQGPLPAEFKKLENRNPLLAKELCKLPELQDGISVEEESAMLRLVDLYESCPSKFDEVFDKMYGIGKPGVRKYCTPLQALFWLAEDEQFTSENNPLLDYSLNQLLDRAWKLKQNFSYVMSDREIDAIIESIRASDDKERYLEFRQKYDNAQMQQFFITEVTAGSNIFSKKAEEMIKRAMSRPRWEDFGTVIDRLNAPELIDYYERKKFVYVDWRKLPTPSVSPRYVFKHNKGECVSITGFTIYCLNKAGYKARELRVSSYSGRYPFHAVCLFEMNGRQYVMDNGQPRGAGIIPYEVFKNRASAREEQF